MVTRREKLKVVDLPKTVANANASAKKLWEALHVSRHRRGFQWVSPLDRPNWIR
jgi:hypothetical protein